MSTDRFYCENITEPICQLDGAEAKHIAKVMRAKVGDQLELFDGFKPVEHAPKPLNVSQPLEVRLEELRGPEIVVYREACEAFEKGPTYQDCKSGSMAESLKTDYGLFKVKCYRKYRK